MADNVVDSGQYAVSEDSDSNNQPVLIVQTPINSENNQNFVTHIRNTNNQPESPKEESTRKFELAGLPSYSSLPRNDENPHPPPYETGTEPTATSQEMDADVWEPQPPPLLSRVINSDAHTIPPGPRRHFTHPLWRSCGRTERTWMNILNDVDSSFFSSDSSFCSVDTLSSTTSTMFSPDGELSVFSRPHSAISERYFNRYLQSINCDNLRARRCRRSDNTPLPNLVPFSCLVTLCCNLPCGLVALYFAVTAMLYAEKGDFESARRISKVSFYINILSVCSSILLLIIVVSSRTFY